MYTSRLEPLDGTGISLGNLPPSIQLIDTLCRTSHVSALPIGSTSVPRCKPRMTCSTSSGSRTSFEGSNLTKTDASAPKVVFCTKSSTSSFSRSTTPIGILFSALKNSRKNSLIASNIPMFLGRSRFGAIQFLYWKPPFSLTALTTLSAIVEPGGTAKEFGTSAGIDQGPEAGNAPERTSSVSLPALTTRK